MELSDSLTGNFTYNELPAIQVIADEVPFSSSTGFTTNEHEDTLNVRVYTICRELTRDNARETLSEIIANLERVANEQINSQDNWSGYGGMTLSVATVRDIKKIEGGQYLGRAETQISMSKTFSV